MILIQSQLCSIDQSDLFIPGSGEKINPPTLRPIQHYYSLHTIGPACEYSKSQPSFIVKCVVSSDIRKLRWWLLVKEHSHWDLCPLLIQLFIIVISYTFSSLGQH